MMIQSTTSVDIKKKNRNYYIHVCIYLAITFGIGYLPTIGNITPLGMKVLGVFIGTIYGWLTLGLIWPSLFAMCALGLVGYISVQKAFTDGFGYFNIPILVLSFIFAAIAEKTMITEYLANWLMSRKIIIGRPYALMAVLFFGMEALTLLGAGFVGVFMLWAMIVKLAETAGYIKGDKFVFFMIPTVLVVFVLAGFIFPFKAGSLIMIGLFTKGMGIPMPDLPYIIWQLTIVNVYIIAALLTAKFVLRLDVSKLSAQQGDIYATLRGQKMNGDQKFGLSLLVSYIVMMLIPVIFPSTWGISKIFSALGILGVLSLLLIVATARRNKEGNPYIELQQAAKGISWDVIWLITATTPLAAAFNAEECGIMSTLMGQLTPILTNMSPAIFIVACTIVLGICTQLVHNLILAIVFIPILTPLCAQLGGNPYACFLVVNMALMMAFATPAASMNAGIIFGHSWMTPKAAYFQGTLHLILGLAVALIVGLPLANLLF